MDEGIDESSFDAECWLFHSDSPDNVDYNLNHHEEHSPQLTDSYFFYDDSKTFFSDCDDESTASPDLSFDINDVVTPDDVNFFYAQCCEIDVDLERANTFEELHHSFDYHLAEQHLYSAKQIDVDIDEPENDFGLDNDKIYVSEAHGQINTREGQGVKETF